MDVINYSTCCSVLSVRDLQTWVNFMNTTTPRLTPAEAFYHGAHLVLLDALGCGDYATTGKLGQDMREMGAAFLQELIKNQGSGLFDDGVGPESLAMDDVGGRVFGFHPFFIEKGKQVFW